MKLSRKESDFLEVELGEKFRSPKFNILFSLNCLAKNYLSKLMPFSDRFGVDLDVLRKTYESLGTFDFLVCARRLI